MLLAFGFGRYVEVVEYVVYLSGTDGVTYESSKSWEEVHIRGEEGVGEFIFGPHRLACEESLEGWGVSNRAFEFCVELLCSCELEAR